MCKALHGLTHTPYDTTTMTTDTIDKNKVWGAPHSSVEINGKMVKLDEHGKICRSCNSLKDFQAAMGGGKSMSAMFGAMNAQKKKEEAPKGYRDDPADVEILGRATWTFLHTMAAQYPDNPSETQKKEMTDFMSIFSRVYPCWFCASDFQKWMTKSPPQVDSKDILSKWLCKAHNEVNVKIGKPVFDCANWKKRWLDGWE